MRNLLLMGLGIMITLGCSEKVPPEQELFERAREFETAQNFNNAIETYDMIIENYPESPNRYKAIFMKGYIYTDILKDKNKAVEALDTLLAEYPDCDLADDAEIMRDIAIKGSDLMSVFEDSLGTK